MGEGPLVEDAASTIEQVYRAYGPPVLVIGESLGAGVAAAAAARQREQVAGLLLITPWDRLEKRRWPSLSLVAGALAAARSL